MLEFYAAINDPTISRLNMLAFIYQGDVWSIGFELDENGLMQPDDSTLVNLTGAGFDVWNRHAVWSPDGTYLAIVTWTDTTAGTLSELIVLDVLLDEEIVLWSGSIFDGLQGEPTWSPDGSEIAMEFVERSQGSTRVDLVRITNWDDSANRRILAITQSRGTHEYEPAWNPGHVVQ